MFVSKDFHEDIKHLSEKGYYGWRAKIDSFDENCAGDIETFWFYLSLEGGLKQGFGGFTLTEWSDEFKRRIGTSAGHDLLIQFKLMFGVKNLSETAGRRVIALYNEKPGLLTGASICGLALDYFDAKESKDAIKYVLISEWQDLIAKGVYNK